MVTASTDFQHILHDTEGDRPKLFSLLAPALPELFVDRGQPSSLTPFECFAGVNRDGCLPPQGNEQVSKASRFTSSGPG
jgi:hypothetical protein